MLVMSSSANRMLERDGASATGNHGTDEAKASWFVDVSRGDLHLVDAAGGAIDQGEPLPPADCPDDIDGETRDDAPDLGADEH